MKGDKRAEETKELTGNLQPDAHHFDTLKFRNDSKKKKNKNFESYRERIVRKKKLLFPKRIKDITAKCFAKRLSGAKHLLPLTQTTQKKDGGRGKAEIKEEIITAIMVTAFLRYKNRIERMKEITVLCREDKSNSSIYLPIYLFLCFFCL